MNLAVFGTFVTELRIAFRNLVQGLKDFWINLSLRAGHMGVSCLFLWAFSSKTAETVVKMLVNAKLRHRKGRYVILILFGEKIQLSLQVSPNISWKCFQFLATINLLSTGQKGLFLINTATYWKLWAIL